MENAEVFPKPRGLLVPDSHLECVYVGRTGKEAETPARRGPALVHDLPEGPLSKPLPLPLLCSFRADSQILQPLRCLRLPRGASGREPHV